MKKKTAVILVPGVSGGAASGRYDAIKIAVESQGWEWKPFTLWTNGEELNRLTLREIKAALDIYISELLASGVTDIFAIGKSFGGGILLAFPNTAIQNQVLLAPAFSDSADKYLSL